MNQSLSFREPVPLGHELHKRFSVPAEVEQSGWSGLELGISLPPGWLGCKDRVSALVK